MFSALVLSLPTRNSTLRMRLWRALKDGGCGVLRDGVYLLPAGDDRHATLAALEKDIRASGGFAMTSWPTFTPGGTSPPRPVGFCT